MKRRDRGFEGRRDLKPQIDPAGGRDHWTHRWTMLMAGDGVCGGQVIGASDEIGAYPKERPVMPAEIAVTICRSLGIDSQTELTAENGQKICIHEKGKRPVLELF